MKINQNASATGWLSTDRSLVNTGLTIRTQIAAMAMQGILANSGDKYKADYVANKSVMYADYLIKELNKTTP